MTIGEKIKTRRNELKWSQQYLADLMGFKDKTSISKIEKGKTKIDTETAMEFATALRVPVATFYEDPSPEVNEALMLMDAIDKGKLLQCNELFLKLTSENQDLIIEIMRRML